jgi:drug/metabolite transporter (DMT)-like permease
LSLSLSMLLYFWVIDKIDVTQASLSIYLLPVFGVLLSTFVVKEKITAPLMFGGLLVFAGTFLVTVYEERKRMRNMVMQKTKKGDEWPKRESLV